MRAEEPLVCVDLLMIEALEQHGERAATVAEGDRVRDEGLVACTQTPCLRVIRPEHRLLDLELLC